MAHGRRLQSELGIYHVMCRGVGRQIIFEDDEDRSYLLDRLDREKTQCGVKVLAWCLMDNHVHLLIQADGAAPGAFMQRVLSEYAVYFNRRHDRVGHVFQDRYRSEPVDTEEYLLTLVRYIHQNPIEMGVSDLRSYRWSSYREYVGEATVTDTALVTDLFGSISEFVRFNEERGENGPAGPTTANDAPERAWFVAVDEVGEETLREMKSLPREDRDRYVARLLARGLSIRQIERFTGVSRGVVAKVSKALRS